MYHFSMFLKPGDKPYGNISNLELKDGYFGASLCSLFTEQLEDIRQSLICNMQRIVIYTLNMPLDEKESYLRAFRAAALLRIKFIKICLCTLERGSEARIAQMREIIAMANAFHLKVLFEGGGKYDFFDTACYQKIRNENTGLIFNPLHYVKEGRNPFLNVMYKSKCRDDIQVLRINDGLYEGGIPVMIEEGNAEIKECASSLLVRGFEGYFSFKPYLPEVPVSHVIKRFLQTLCEM